MFWNFILGIALYFLQLVLAPKPQNAKPASLQDFNVPVAEEGKEIPVVFGTVNIKSPNVVWYGDLRLLPIKGPRRYGFFGPRQVIGYKYGLGMHMVLCHAVHDEIREIWAGNKQIFPKPITAAVFEGSGTIVIDQADIFGGDDGQGGISGNVHVLGGDPAQAQDSYLASVLAGANTPAFRGVVSIVWEHIYVGNSPYIQPWEFVLKRIHQTSRGETQWYNAKAAVPDSHTDTVGTDTGVTLEDSVATFNQQNYIDTNGEWAARGQGDNIWVWHLPDGAEQTRDLGTGGGGVPLMAVHITEFDELVVRTGGSFFGGSTSITFLDVSDITTTTQSSIDIHSIITGYGDTDTNWGFWVGEYGDYMLIRVTPEVAANPWILLHRVTGTWGVDSHHAGAEVLIDGISMGPTYAYAIFSGGGTSVYRIKWDNSTWAVSTVNLTTHTGGNNVQQIHYFSATGEVIVKAGNGIYVLSEDLSTLLRSKNDFSPSISGMAASSKRMALDSTHIQLWSSDVSTYAEIYTFNISTMEVDSTLPVKSTALVNSASPSLSIFMVNQDQGGAVIGGHNTSTLLSFWPTAAADALDMNPAHIIRECLTDRTWGMGYNAADIDDDSFTAAADTLWDECFGLSLQWVREERIEEFISVILSHIDAFLYLRRTTGKFYLKLIRNDYTLGDLPVFDEDDVVTWDEVARREPPEAVNSVIVKYTDRRNRGNDAAHSYDNIAEIQQIGERISATRFYPGISRGDLAIRVAARDQRSLGIGMISGRLTGKRTWDSLYPGDPFRLVTARHNLDGEVMRVASMKFGDGRDNKIGLKFAQDVFRLNANELVDTAATDWENPRNPPSAVTPRLVWEMPYLELKQMIGPSDTGTLLSDDPDAGMLEVAGGKPTADSLDAAIYVDGSREDVMTFAPTGLLDADIAAFDTAITITDDTDIDLIEVGQLAAIIGATTATTEIVKITAIAGNDLTISRGFLDTVPQAHSLGDALVVFDDLGMSDFIARTAGDVLHVKLQTRTAGGVLALSLAPTNIVTLDSRAVRPLRPADCKIEGDGSGDEVDVTATDPFEATWANRNRLTESTPLTWTGGSVSLEASATITLALIAADGTTIIDDTTYSGLTGTSANIDHADFLGELEGFVRFTTERDGYGPWQAFQIPVGLVTQISITADPGSYALTGTAATLHKGKALTAAAGSYTLTGSAASLIKANFTLSAGVGSYALTGTAVALSKSKTLTAGAGSYAITGTAATLSITDASFSSVVFLSHFENNPVIDIKGHTWTNNGTAQASTSRAKFDTASYHLPDLNTAYGSVPSSTDWNFGSGEFTIEFWINYDTVTEAAYNGILCRDSIGGTRGWLIVKQQSTDSPANALSAAVFVGATPYAVTDTITPSTVTWYHYAFVRDQSSGDVLRLYRDGVQVSTNASVTGSVGAPSEPMICGILWGVGAVISGTSLDAWIDELRITKGVCRYPSGTTFTPQTAAFPNS